MESEAHDIIEQFGGARPLAAALSAVTGRAVAPSTIYRWTYPVGKNDGTGGVIPTAKRRLLKRAARMHGLVLRGNF